MIVLDTNVVSELMRPVPDASVLGWMRRQPARQLCTTAISVAEIQYGVQRLPDGRRKDVLVSTLTEVFGSFATQIIPFDAAAAAEYASVVLSRERIGTPIDGFDAQIAAICRATGAVLATRNTKDFIATDVGLTNPWRA